MRFAVLTSGGDAPGMNAAIRSVVRTVIAHNDTVYGIYEGYKGLVEGNFKEFNRSDVSEILSKGGTMLGTARLTEFIEREVQLKALEQLKKY